MGFDTPSQVSKPPRAPEPGPSLERCGEPSNARNPLRGAPQRATFQDKALRERIAREREAGDVDLARAPLFDRLLSELERVDATRRARVVASICDGLSITSEELAAYDRRDEQEWRAAWEAWADSPSTPVLWVIRSPRLYEAPSAARRTPEALVAWAAKCAQEERCDVVLIPDRRTRVFVDSAGAVVARTTITPGWEERARPSDG